eukprot:CAMPEP_0171962214 /NCGR_PEP_ID=MMETSP0993-20121228/167649_1 /TAXON_ID=483369 /ORGANISM="non described non described, Strain CCMP2098" /LENGTH=36 /DNA_ID= /DNA_START= /DNA_END= /DNA_ORIENTATION=
MPPGTQWIPKKAAGHGHGSLISGLVAQKDGQDPCPP